MDFRSKVRKIKKIVKNNSIPQVLPYILIVAGVVGCIASFALTYDKIHVLLNPNYRPSCNLNPILSCGSVMSAPQSNLMGVPNTIFGLMGFSALLTFGVILAAGTKVKRSIWLMAQLAALSGVIFMHYLFYQGVYKINAICPWCFTIWMITIPTFIYITVYNLKEKNIEFSKRFESVSLFIQKHHGDILVMWYFIIFALLAKHFWWYWKTLI